MIVTPWQPSAPTLLASLSTTLVDGLNPNQKTSQQYEIEAGWHEWLSSLFPRAVDRSFASYHEEFWDWVWSLEDGEPAPPFVAVWPRGAGKSSSSELACAMTAARHTRRYALYVCMTQEQADDHVANVAGLLETSSFADAYPDVASRKIGKYGNIRGWRRNRLRTASGFTLDAIGLDTAARGVKIDDERPDLLILDDIDHELDSPEATAKRIRTMTRALIPSRSAAGTVLAVQNLIIPDGIFSRLVDGRAEFLADRIVSGPHPAIKDLVYETREGKTVITGGTPTWPAGMGLDVCQNDLNLMGLTAFLAEKQHEVEPPAGGMFDHLEFRHCEWKDVPDLVRVAIWVDPAVTDTKQSDSHGIQADGIASDGTIYRLFSWEARTSPHDALQRAIRKAVELGSLTVGVETDQGGDTWESTYREALRGLIEAGDVSSHQAPRFASEKASHGYGPKVHRAGQMLAAYERGEIVHVVGTHDILERALRRFPKTKPYDLVDASFWSWHDLTANNVPTVAPVSMEQANTWEMGGY
jgi:hypothetical protein